VTKSRLEAFSDGVLAIAITLPVIDLRPPQLEPGKRLAHALWQHWPSYVAYLVSFLTIGVLWLNHHWILEQVVQVDVPLLVLNLNVLLRTALLPFPTAVLPSTWGGGEAARTAAALYSGVLMLLALAEVALFAWVIHNDRLHRLPPATVAATRMQFLVGPAIYGAAFVLSWVSPLLGLAVCGAMALNHGRHHLRRRPGADAG
jgi:TMEM175 potassium channel family protein